MQLNSEPSNPFSYWGKARPTKTVGPQFHLLPFHCLDVAATGRAYLQRHPTLLDWMARQTGIAESALLGWLTFWLSLHDLGKFATRCSPHARG